jgi:hypothetical protein
MSDVMIYSERRDFLIATTSDQRNRYEAKHSDDVWYGLASTEHQFRQALCDLVFPSVEKLSKQKLQEMMADELKTLGEN